MTLAVNLECWEDGDIINKEIRETRTNMGRN